MSDTINFDQKITLKLNLDEAIVLTGYLSRALWNEGGEKVQASFVHRAEQHGPLALLQDLAMPVSFLTPEPDGIELTAREHLLRRHT